MRGRNGISWAVVAGVALVLCGVAFAEVVGKATAPLDARGVREAECSLGSLVADAMKSSLGAELALLQASQLRPALIPAGEVTREALTGALLYPDERVVLVEVSGAQIKAALERSLSMAPKPSTSFLQVSGLTVTFRSEAPPEQRVVEARVGGAPLSAEKTYRVAMPASLAKGALGYFRIFNGLQPKETGPAIGEAVVEYVLAARTVAAQGGRIRDLSRPAG